MSAALPIALLLVGVGAIAMGGGSKKSGAKRTTPNLTSQGAVPQWCKDAGKWNEAQRSLVVDAIRRQLAPFPAFDGNVDDARRITYEVTKLVLAEVCGGVELPPEYYNLTNYYETKQQWWRALWDAVSLWTWNHYVEIS